MKTDFRVAIYNSRWLLLISLVIQIVFCITQVGYFHPDQHFQLIEFSSWQLGEPSGATSVWELKSHIRPTIQVYLFSGFVETCRFIGVYDAYTQLTILRLVFGLLGFLLFNTIGIYYFKSNQKLLNIVLLLINLSWLSPYIRTLFSSEMGSAMLFFGAIFLYESKNKNNIYIFLIGFLFSLTFFFRFQMLFGMLGFGLWMIVIEKRYIRMLPLLIGFFIGLIVNVFLDYLFYQELVFTPYEYYRVNITEGKAAEFGTADGLYYLVMLLLVVGTPPLSAVFFYYSLKGIVRQYRQPLVFVIVAFVLGHSFVAHKEERFLFPILSVLPILTGWGLESVVSRYENSKKKISGFLNGIIYTSIGLTIAVFIALAFNPLSQSIEFSRKITEKFRNDTPTLYCFARTPFETPSSLPLTFYRRNSPNIKLVEFQDIDSVRHIKNGWLTTTYNAAKGKHTFLDSLGFKPQLYSSTALWHINQFLESKQINTINEIWVLYKKE